MRHASSLKTASRPTTSSSSGPSTEPSPSSSVRASTGGPCSGSRRSHRFETSTRLAKRSSCVRRPAATSLVARSRSASTNSRSASAVAGESAPLMRTTPLFSSSFPSTERGGSRLATGLALALGFPLAFLTPPVAFAAPKPAPLSARPPFCTRTSSAVPSCSSERSFSARAATARSWSSWSCDLPDAT
eukprot:scaffold64126_cov63-Phaeocystis_antarctica.AAC.3